MGQTFVQRKVLTEIRIASAFAITCLGSGSIESLDLQYFIERRGKALYNGVFEAISKLIKPCSAVRIRFREVPFHSGCQR